MQTAIDLPNVVCIDGGDAAETYPGAVTGPYGVAGGNYVPDGGTAGQYLIKQSATDGDAIWDDFGGGGGGFTVGTKVNLAAQTSVDFSSLPADIKTVHVTFKSLSTSATGSSGRPILRIGSGGVPRVSGQYVGGIGQIATVSGSGGSIFGIELALSSTWTAAQSISGQVIFTLHDAATDEWCWNGSLFSSSVSSVTWVTQGTVNLLGVLDIIRLTTIGGTATLDAGSINIAYST